MAIRFAKRMEALNGSEIRELLKLIEKPEVISFAGGLPAPRAISYRGNERNI